MFTRFCTTSFQLLRTVASEAYPEAVEASLRLGAKALQMVGTPEVNVELMLQDVRCGAAT